MAMHNLNTVVRSESKPAKQMTEAKQTKKRHDTRQRAWQRPFKRSAASPLPEGRRESRPQISQRERGREGRATDKDRDYQRIVRANARHLISGAAGGRPATKRWVVANYDTRVRRSERVGGKQRTGGRKRR